MRVLFVTHNFPRHPGDAAGSFLLRLAQALGNAGVDVRVLAPVAGDGAGEPHSSVEGIAVERYRYAPRGLETLAHAGTMAEQVRGSMGGKIALAGLLGAGVAALAGAARRHRPDIVHAHWWFPAGAIALGARPFLAAPLVTTMHGSDVRLASGGAGAGAMRAVLRASAASTTVSSWLADEVERLTGAARPAVAPMPVAVELFIPGPPVVERAGGALFVGRLSQQKGIDHLLDALAATRAPVHLDVVGDAPHERRAALQQQAAALGIADRVTWHGAVPQSALASFYRNARVLVVPSREEGLGLVAAEAQLCETPVIAFDSGGLRDVVVHERTGILVKQLDAETLARAIDALLDRADGGASLGRAGRPEALARFAPSAVARRYQDVYEAALGGRPPR